MGVSGDRLEENVYICAQEVRTMDFKEAQELVKLPKWVVDEDA